MRRDLLQPERTALRTEAGIRRLSRPIDGMIKRSKISKILRLGHMPGISGADRFC